MVGLLVVVILIPGQDGGEAVDEAFAICIGKQDFLVG